MPKPETTRGFSVTCPLCGEEGSVNLTLANVDTLTCSSCSDDFSVSRIRSLVAEWSRFLAWHDRVEEALTGEYRPPGGATGGLPTSKPTPLVALHDDAIRQGMEHVKGKGA